MKKRLRDESGTGMVSTGFGAVVFLAFLALAAHTLIGLYATSVVSSVAWDDARRIAVDPSNADSVDNAKADATRRLSGFKDVQLDVVETDDDVAFHVSAQRPMLLPAALASHTGLSRINKTAHVRPEQLR